MNKIFNFKTISLSFLTLIAVSFQNCSGGGFGTDVGVIDQNSQGTVADPQVRLSAQLTALSNSRILNVSIVVTVDPKLQVRSLSCQLDSEAAINCISLSATFAAIADGDHRLLVTIEDTAGKSAQSISLFRIDGTAPVLAFSQAPAAVTGSTTADFIFTANDALSGIAATECSLDAAVFATCPLQVNLGSLTTAPHTFRIRGRDLAGNISTPVTHSWTISAGAPVITISQRPNAVTNLTTANFVFSGTDTGQAITSFQCSLDAGSYGVCLSPQAYSGLAAGAHTFNIRGLGISGAYSSPVSYNWTIDVTAPPVPTLTSNITSPTRQTAANISFSSMDASGIASYQCSLDAAAYATCTSPRPLTGLADGSHTLSVRAIDNAGNASGVAASTWVVDTTLPTVALSQMPTASTTQTTAAFTFAVTDAGSGVQSRECQLDAAAYAACTTTANYTGLALGNHSFNIRANDVAGNQRILNYAWTITSPTTTTIPPSNPGNGLVIDLSYVDKTSTQYTRFKSMVDDALAGNPDYGFEPQHAAIMYKLTGEVRYCDYAITFVETCPSRYETAECGVEGAEAAIAAGGRAPVSGDSYLEVGPIIGSLAITYDWCSSRLTAAQKTRWANYANQAIFNVWHHETATWGGRPFPWSGWSVDNPGNNYYYSFLEASMYWALANHDNTLLTFVRDVKLKALTDYYATIPGGGSLEGTGYGAAHMRLFYLYKVWKDSTASDLANINSHLTDSIRFWTHATTPSRSLYAPIGDLARSSYPEIFDYHRRIMLEAKLMTNNTTAKDLASWWLNHISVTQMGRRVDSQWDMMPAGTNTAAAPTESLTYRAQGVGRVFARTGWDVNALWMTFAAGPYNESHAHQDQGSFELANNSFLAVTNNIYTSSGIEQTTDYNNIIRFVNGGATIPQREGTTSTMTVNQLAATGEMDITANLTPAYAGNANINNWTRNVKFAARKLTVTDNFTVTAGTTGIFQLQVPVLPVINGNLITAGNLRVRVLSPAVPTINVISQGKYRIEITGGTTGYVVEMSDQPL